MIDRSPAPRRVDPDLGPVRWCRRCSEWWPEDHQFWYSGPNDPTSGVCLACKHETRLRSEVRQAQAARRICPTCRLIRTTNPECHGCAGRLAGPLTTKILAALGLDSRVLEAA